MTNLSLEEQVEKLEHILNLYRTVSESDNKETMLSCLKQLSLDNLGILGDTTIRDWIIDFNKGERDDFKITQNIGYYLFSELFDKESLDFSYLKANLGLSVLDLYLKKTKEKKNIGINQNPDIESYEVMLINPFLEPAGGISLDSYIVKDDQNLSDEEKKTLDKISDMNWIRYLPYLKNDENLDLDEDIQELIKKGYNTPQNSFLFSVTKYQREKKSYKKASDLCAERWEKTQEELTKLKQEKSVKDEEIRPFRLQLSKYGCFAELLSDLILHSNFLHTRQKRLYNESVSILDQKFPITNDLTYSKLKQLYEDMSNLQNKIFVKREPNLVPTNLIEDSNFSLLAFKEHYSKLIKLLKKKRICSRRNKLLSKAYTSYSNYTPQTINYLNKAINLDKKNYEAHYRLANHYEKINNKKKALVSLTNFIKCYFAEIEDKNLKTLKTSKNEVGKIEASYFFGNLILKKSKKDLSKEYNLTSLIYEITPNKETTSEPIIFIKDRDGTHYIVLRAARAPLGEKDENPPTLGDIMNRISKVKGNKLILSKIGWSSEKEILNNFKINYLKKTVDRLVYIQSFGKKLEDCIEQYDYSDKLKSELELLLPQYKDEVYKNCSFLLKYLTNLPSCFGHCDFNAENILVKEDKSGKNALCIIDYEKVGLVNRYFDLTYLLEQAQLDISPKDKYHLLRYFRAKIGDKTSLREIAKIYDYNALFINLTLGGTCSKWTHKGEEYGKRKQKHLTRAQELLEKMEKDYKLKLDYLKDVLKK